MAKVRGTDGDDFIHVRGDGRTPPDGANNIPRATDDPDTITGGLGDDTIFGGRGADLARFNSSTDGADAIDLGNANDVLQVTADAPTQVRLTFTSAEVGNADARDSGTMPNQDGGLAVRMQAEDGSGALTGAITRVDDEGITFVAGAGVTFDVRDLVSGVARGDQFEVVMLGTSGADKQVALQADRPYYINAGMGDDTLVGGDDNDFLVGGAGADRMTGGDGNDSYIVDNVADRVLEKADGGSDLVLSLIDGRIGANLENLTLSGTADIDGTGNGLDNAVTGNAGANVLDGLRGNDVLTGGAGGDTFAFTTRLGADNVDAIADLSVADDTILLDSDVFKRIETGTLDAGAFVVGEAADSRGDRIIYNDDTGELSYDRDGSGTRFDAVAFATLDPGLGLTNDDFLVS